ncbi:MAG: putative branched chain amino acid transporter ATP-binding protein [Frankiales bacterium]|nr:putative branched chain amino acid transporter ATP-binding protein [Frankiales bacterium]
MTEVFRFALLGLGAGALYALAAVGLVLVYRGSGVVNFAQGAMGMIGAYVFFEARDEHGFPALAAVVLGLLASAALGAAFHLLVMRHMREASVLSKIVATLALLVTLQSLATLVYGPLPKIVPSMLPIGPVDVFGAQVGRDRIYILGLVLVLTTLLSLVYRYTTFGVATSGVAENPRAASALGISPNLIGAANWAIGAALGGLSGILLVPITGLAPDKLTLIVIPILAAAVVGRFSSFPVTTATGLAIGVAQSEIVRYVSSPGWGTAVPFLFVAVVLIARGRAVAGKGEAFGRMPALGTGKLAPGLIALGLVVTLLCAWVFFDADFLAALQIQLVISIILLSFVVVTGYAGQISLAQVGFAGLGAVVAAYLFSSRGWSFELALVGGTLAVIPVGLVVGLAGVRTRGVNLAILTFGLAISLEAVVFGNQTFTGGSLGYRADDPTVFGIDVSGITHPERFATLTLVLLVLLALAVTNLRRGRAGRRLIAVRTNERAAAALGISVVGAKLYAFVLGGMIAAVGGILLAFRQPVVAFGEYAGLQSVLVMQNAVLGGVGVVGGPLVASGFGPGTVGQHLFSFIGTDVAAWIAIVSGVLVLLMLVLAPDGLAVLQASQSSKLLTTVRSRLPRRSRPVVLSAGSHDYQVVPKALELEGVTVRFGGNTALSDLTLSVRPGEVVGLIGPNGAGKSTTIDAITGFVQPSAGTVRLGGEPIDTWSRERRARAGLGRSFQSLELFEDLTVLENIQTACDRRDVAAYVTGLVSPGHDALTDAAQAVIADFGLQEVLHVKVQNLEYAQRRMLAVARAVAGGHSVLLLDEPAAGLSDRQTRRLAAGIRKLAADRGVAVLLVEHNVDMVLRTCDRVHALAFGQTIGEGTPAEIRTQAAVVEAYLGTKRYRDEAVVAPA